MTGQGTDTGKPDLIIEPTLSLVGGKTFFADLWAAGSLESTEVLQFEAPLPNSIAKALSSTYALYPSATIKKYFANGIESRLNPFPIVSIAANATTLMQRSALG